MSKLTQNDKKILIFPGQGSQYGGMSKELALKFPKADLVYECGSDILGYDLKELIHSDDTDSRLTDTRFVQPAIFAASLVSLIAAQESGVCAEYHAAAGHSLGEYAALVCCGVLDMENGFKIIKSRSTVMAQAGSQNPGGMAAVIGLSAEEVNAVCEQVRQSGIYVTLANHNSPQQVVIAGETVGLDKAEELLKQKEVKRLKIVRLKVSAAFHSVLMIEAAQIFKKEAEKITFLPPKADFYSNVTTDKLTDFTNMPEYLSAHITSPVMFVPQLMNIQKDGYDTFVEVGPGKVLSGLVKKTFDDAKTYNIEDLASLNKITEVPV